MVVRLMGEPRCAGGGVAGRGSAGAMAWGGRSPSAPPQPQFGSITPGMVTASDTVSPSAGPAGPSAAPPPPTLTRHVSADSSAGLIPAPPPVPPGTAAAVTSRRAPAFRQPPLAASVHGSSGAGGLAGVGGVGAASPFMATIRGIWGSAPEAGAASWPRHSAPLHPSSAQLNSPAAASLGPLLPPPALPNGGHVSWGSTDGDPEQSSRPAVAPQRPPPDVRHMAQIYGLCCPLTRELMREPMVASDGVSSHAVGPSEGLVA